MLLRNVARGLVKIGSISGLVLGIILVLWSSYWLVVKFVPPVPIWNIFDIILIILNILAIIASILVYKRYLPRIEEDPYGSAIIFLALGILIAIGAWGIGGILIFVGGIIIIVEESA